MPRRICLDDYDYRPVPGHEPGFRPRLYREKGEYIYPRERTMFEASANRARRGPFLQGLGKSAEPLAQREEAREHGTILQMVTSTGSRLLDAVTNAVDSVTGGAATQLIDNVAGGAATAAHQVAEAIHQQAVVQQAAIQQAETGIVPATPAAAAAAQAVAEQKVQSAKAKKVLVAGGVGTALLLLLL